MSTAIKEMKHLTTFSVQQIVALERLLNDFELDCVCSFYTVTLNAPPNPTQHDKLWNWEKFNKHPLEYFAVKINNKMYVWCDNGWFLLEEEN